MEHKLQDEKIKRKVIVKRESITNPDYGCNPNERPTEELVKYGIININKPRGPTSHQVSSYLKHILGIKKSGHSGTLDPKVTGMLPIAIGRATRIVQALLLTGKEYVAIMHVHKVIKPETIEKICNDFVGKIKQIPPIKSSVKRKQRVREIYYLDILEIIEQDILFKVGCQAGTYIRKLIHDIGKRMGSGAHMAELIRTKVGPFTTETMYSLQDVADAIHYWKKGDDTAIRKIIQPVENGIKHLPRIWILNSAVNALCHGHDLAMPGISKYESCIQKGELVAILTLKNELIALGHAQLSSKDMITEKGIAVKTEKVFMLPGVYPKSV